MDIKRLLSKKGWTGEETGKALIYSLVNDYKQTLSGNRDPKPLFSHERIRQMVQGFRASRGDITAYNRYVHLQNWIKQYQAVANAYFQRFQSSINEFISVVRATETAENQYRYIEGLPRIMTQKQYDDLKAKRIEETLCPNGEDLADTVFALIVRAIEYYAQELERNPKKANPLKAVKKLYSSTPVSNKDIIRIYLKEAGYGYHVLPDGTRSDKATPEEWEEGLKKYSPDFRRAMEEEEAGIPQGTEGTLAYERALERARAAREGEEAPQKFDKPATWHVYEEPPEDLNKWDIIRDSALCDGASFYDYFPFLAGEEVADEEAIEQAAAFKKEFTEAVEAVIKALDAMDFPLIEEDGEEKPLSAISMTKWVDTLFSWKALYEWGFPGFREWVEADTTIFDGDKRALFNGVAILRPSDLLAASSTGRTSAAIDENGYFIEPSGGDLFSNMFGLESYTPANPECGDAIDHVERNRAALEDSLRWILGYDTAVDLIATEIGIPEFSIFKVDVDRCMARTKALNGLFDLAYKHIKEIDYQDKAKQEAKLQAIRDVFYPVKTDELAIPADRIKEAAKMLEELEAFGESDSGITPGWNFLATLTGIEEGGGEE